MIGRVPPHPPLAGRRIAITRPREQAMDLVTRLEALGAAVTTCSTIAIAPPERWDELDDAVRAIAGYDWVVFTSANSVEAFAARCPGGAGAATAAPRPRIAAVGPATARAAASLLRGPIVIPPVHVAEALADALGEVRGQRVLFPCADIAREALPAVLRARGAQVDRVTAYRTVPGDGVQALIAHLRAGDVDAVLFTSASGVRYFVEGVARTGAPVTSLFQPGPGPAVVCLGPMTAAAARAGGLPVDGVAVDHSTNGLVDVVTRWFMASSRRT